MNKITIDKDFISTLTTDKVIINGVEVTDIESWNKAISTFSELQAKIEIYKNERDTYKRLAECYINKYNKERSDNNE